MADALASGASGSNTVWVQVPSPARKALSNQGFFLYIIWFWRGICETNYIGFVRSI